MPKAKPTQVIVHRVELQEKEREMLEVALSAQVVKEIGQTVAVASGVGAAAWLAYKSLKPNGWAEDLIDDIKNTPAQRGAEIFRDYTPAGQVAKGLTKFIKWGFTPQESP